MKCGVCGNGLGPTWFSIAAKMASGTILVTNMHRECLDGEIGRPARRRLDAAMFRTGWVQESLPVGI